MYNLLLERRKDKSTYNMTNTDNNREEPQTPDELKMQALLERVAQLTADYENKVADLRVAYTVVTQERDALRAQLQSEADAARSE